MKRSALRLLLTLARLREDGHDAPVPAIMLADAIGVPSRQSHESRRRRVRAVVRHARQLLREGDEPTYLVADGSGYWLTMDRGELRRYLGRRRRAGLTHLAETGRVERSGSAAQAAGQGLLFDNLIAPG